MEAVSVWKFAKKNKKEEKSRKNKPFSKLDIIIEEKLIRVCIHSNKFTPIERIDANFIAKA